MRIVEFDDDSGSSPASTLISRTVKETATANIFEIIPVKMIARYDVMDHATDSSDVDVSISPSVPSTLYHMVSISTTGLVLTNKRKMCERLE